MRQRKLQLLLNVYYYELKFGHKMAANRAIRNYFLLKKEFTFKRVCLKRVVINSCA